MCNNRGPLTVTKGIAMATTRDGRIEVTDENQQYRKELFDLSGLWEELDSQIYLVIDDQGQNMEGGRVRRINGEHWLSVDGVDGFKVVSDRLVGQLIKTKLDDEARERYGIN